MDMSPRSTSVFACLALVLALAAVPAQASTRHAQPRQDSTWSDGTDCTAAGAPSVDDPSVDDPTAGDPSSDGSGYDDSGAGSDDGSGYRDASGTDTTDTTDPTDGTDTTDTTDSTDTTDTTDTTDGSDCPDNVPAPTLPQVFPNSRPAPSIPRIPPVQQPKFVHLHANGKVWVSPKVPRLVREVIAAGNRIAKLPYRYGGGHGSFVDTAYDCSGSVSYALHAAGLLNATLTSGMLESYGAKGKGRWITIYANKGHTFMVIAGMRFDTVARAQSGSRWAIGGGWTHGFVVRHPPGL